MSNINKELTPLDALEELKFQVGNITYHTHDLQITTFKVRDSGLFDIIEKELKEHEQYKAIEEELGIDLLTYFKIRDAKNVYVKDLFNGISEMLVRPSKDNIDVFYKGFVDIPECDSCLRLKDYGKTWALTIKELL